MDTSRTGGTGDVQTPQQILDTWFRDEKTGRMDLSQHKRWFSGGGKLDRLLTEQYSETLRAAGEGELDDWLDTAESTLALIILLDQFNRNINRGTAKAFEHDAKALNACKYALKMNYPEGLPIAYKMFFYMPLMHDESIDSQTLAINLFSQLKDEASDDFRQFAEHALASAQEHRTIIAQFGRYPYRNAVLNRENTAEEQEWLASGSKRFGQ